MNHGKTRVVALDAVTAECGLDGSRSDKGYLTCLKGGITAMALNPDLKVIFVGEKETLEHGLDELLTLEPGLSGIISPDNNFHYSKSRIRMDDDVKKIVFDRDTSIAACARLVDLGEADIFVSPGSTGATIASAKYDVSRLDTRHKLSARERAKEMLPQQPAMIARIPNVLTGKLKYLCDAGAIAKPSAVNLSDFALMLTIYLENVERMYLPRIALLNIGEEEGKGDSLHNEVYERLKKYHTRGVINFVGNAEPRDIYSSDRADGFVSDAQSGNIFLKTSEAIFDVLRKELKSEFQKNSVVFQAMAAPAMKKIACRLKDLGDMKRLGGAYVIGARYDAVVAHGSASYEEIAGSVLYAAHVAKRNLAKEISDELRHEHWYVT